MSQSLESEPEQFLLSSYSTLNNMDFVKHGFILSFYFLLKAAKEVEKRGSDELSEQFFYDAI